MGQRREWARLAFEVARGDPTPNDGEKEPLPTSREAISREKLMHSSVKSSIISIFSKKDCNSHGEKKQSKTGTLSITSSN